MILTVDGQNYDITNWDDFQGKFLSAIGHILQREIGKEIARQGLVGVSQRLKLGVEFVVKGNELIMTSTAPHAAAIEFGSVGTEKGVIDPFGERSRGPKQRKAPPIDALEPWAKLRGIDNVWALAKHIQKFGTPPFAPYRRVMYNQNKMAQVISKAARNVSL